MNIKISILFILLLFITSGCGWLYTSHESGADLSKADLYVEPFAFTTQDEEETSTEQLQGQVWIANMIFTRCPSVCTIMTPNMKNLQDALIEQDINARLISFTVDPSFDIPDRLKSYGENVGADFSKWTFATGYTDEDITSFAADSFLTLVQDIKDSNDMIHGTSFYLIDKDGKIVRKFDGLDPDIAPIVKQAKKLVK
ncbi:SCO family protein [Bacillus alkalicellulosilyticus]|uniref:SCO family protein n=1 Tax=Alkalihalobacterium alkalicellulosilyticum TaxID=1912214 RepID=UPI00111747E8|nr:SCO family protein [Bacillus alkalicellulosilyticus]